jgi:hypothetical protein
VRHCYISGPMRRWPLMNYPAFYAAERELQAAGWTVFNPARMSEEDAPGVPSDGSPQSCRAFAEQDLEVIVGVLRAEDGDAIVVLPEWEKSKGALAEVAVARWVRLPVLTLEEALRG